MKKMRQALTAALLAFSLVIVMLPGMQASAANPVRRAEAQQDIKMLVVNAVLYHYEGEELHIYLIASLTISITILLTILVAKFSGSMLPMVAKKIGFDPAVMAAPFITTMIDVASLLLLYAMANVILLRII